MGEQKQGINSEENSGYRVGYCRPPREYQWRPGQSGNPRGRPKGAVGRKKRSAELDRMLSELYAGLGL